MAGDRSKLKALSDIALLDISLEFDEMLKNILKITCEYYLVPNIFEEPGDKPWYDLSRELGFSSRIFMPIKRGQKVTGLLNVNWAEPRKFTEEEIDFLTLAASHASSAVQNARNYSKLEDKRLEASVKESEAIYRELFENAEDPMYTLDIEGHFLTINNSGLRILGCTKEEVIGTHISKWLTPESLLKAQEALKRQVSGESIQYPVILEVISKNTMKNCRNHTRILSRLTG